MPGKFRHLINNATEPFGALWSGGSVTRTVLKGGVVGQRLTWVPAWLEFFLSLAR